MGWEPVHEPVDLGGEGDELGGVPSKPPVVGVAVSPEFGDLVAEGLDHGHESGAAGDSGAVGDAFPVVDEAADESDHAGGEPGGAA